MRGLRNIGIASGMLFIACTLLIGGVALVGRTLTPDNGARAVLAAEACAPPCWFGLEPGASGRTQIVQALAALPGEQAALADELRPNAPLTFLYAGDAGAGAGDTGRALVTLRIEPDDAARPLVAGISLTPDGLTLGGLLRTLGEPQTVLIRNEFIPSGNFFTRFVLYYPALTVYGAANGREVLRPDDSISRLDYGSGARAPAHGVYPWRGLGGLAKYGFAAD